MSGLKTEFIPAHNRESRRLLIVLHGLGDSTAGFSWMPAALDLPWLNYLLVNAPDPYFGGYSWFDFMGDAEPGIVRSRRLLFELLDQQREAGFPSEQTVMFGFSQGCLMTVEIGCRYPHRLAGLVGVSGYVFEPEKLIRELSPAAKEQKFLITHGTQDPLIPFTTVQGQIKTLRAGGLQVEWHEFVKAHTIAGQEELDVIGRFISGC